MGLNAIYLSRLSDLPEKEQNKKEFEIKWVIVGSCITLQMVSNLLFITKGQNWPSSKKQICNYFMINACLFTIICHIGLQARLPSCNTVNIMLK